ncbi:hypothetical protein GZ77_02840 [Endozoicomonas montiporae]|uniref:Uncharacterized protein n=2 Tax=Endozoicomonas montiporae TaxID=1027273 RepID=A0A081NAU4_9GAMM|nr:hypothetical protein [Endozoicomonas montiporae]AMO56737.1 hypothetical protein EZMO1_2675 [Endozoicomonas montiporae CL-33]KEQ15567.1 hypothetical protein GZ77_02840 [Endozoicomonas montiporae]
MVRFQVSRVEENPDVHQEIHTAAHNSDDGFADQSSSDSEDEEPQSSRTLGRYAGLEFLRLRQWAARENLQNRHADSRAVSDDEDNDLSSEHWTITVGVGHRRPCMPRDGFGEELRRRNCKSRTVEHQSDEESSGYSTGIDSDADEENDLSQPLLLEGEESDISQGLPEVSEQELQNTSEPSEDTDDEELMALSHLISEQLREITEALDRLEANNQGQTRDVIDELEEGALRHFFSERVGQDSDVINELEPEVLTRLFTPSVGRHARAVAQEGGVLDPTDRSTFVILFDRVMDSFLDTYRFHIPQVRLNLLNMAMNNHRVDPYSVDNVHLLHREVIRMLKDLAERSRIGNESQILIGEESEFQEHSETIGLMMTLLEDSVFRTEEFELKKKLKKDLQGFGNPGEEALYRVQAGLRVGGGPSVPGAASAILTGYLGATRHDWYVTTDTAKLLFQIKKGVIVGADFSLDTISGAVKAAFRGGVFAGEIDGKLFNNVNDFIQHSWHKYDSMLQFLIFEGEQEMAGWHKSRLLLQLRIQALRDSIIATAAGWR